MLGLNKSLTPSGSNGVLNFLKLMQKKTVRMYTEAEAGKSARVGSGREIGTEVRASVSPVSGIETRAYSGETAPEHRSMKSAIEKILQEALTPTVLVVDDVSHQHAGHAGVEEGAKRSHFNVTVVSDKFKGRGLARRHRLVYRLLDEVQELTNGRIGLSLETKTPSEPVFNRTQPSYYHPRR